MPDTESLDQSIPDHDFIKTMSTSLRLFIA